MRLKKENHNSRVKEAENRDAQLKKSAKINLLQGGNS